MVRAFVLLALLILAVAATAAGCGGDRGDGRAAAGRRAYVTALNRAQRGLQDRFTVLQRRVTPTSTPAQDQRTLRAYEAAVDDAVARLRAITPPPGLAVLHRRLMSDVGAYGTAVRRARIDLRSGRPQTVLAMQGRLRSAAIRAGRRLDATIGAINARLHG